MFTLHGVSVSRILQVGPLLPPLMCCFSPGIFPRSVSWSSYPLLLAPFPWPVGAAPPAVEFGHLTLLNKLKLRLDIVGIDKPPAFVTFGSPVAIPDPEFFSNPDVTGPNTPEVMGPRRPERSPPTRPPPLLLCAVEFAACVTCGELELPVLVLLGK